MQVFMSRNLIDGIRVTAKSPTCPHVDIAKGPSKVLLEIVGADRRQQSRIKKGQTMPFNLTTDMLKDNPALLRALRGLLEEK